MEELNALHPLRPEPGMMTRINGPFSKVGVFVVGFVVSAIFISFFYLMLTIDPAEARGTTEIDCPEGGVSFVAASTNDPPGRPDPGYDIDVAECTARVHSDVSVLVSIRKGYPSYTCTFKTTIKNRGATPVCLASVESLDSAAFSIAGLKGLKGKVLQPGQQTIQTFSIHIEQEAEPGTRYRFKIKELFRAMVPGKSGACGGRVLP